MRWNIMLLIILLILIILLATMTGAQVDIKEFESVGAENMIITSDLDISSSFRIIPEKSDYKVSEVIVELKLKPFDNWRQQLISMALPPNNKQTSDSVVFTWIDPMDLEQKYYLRSKIKISNKIKQITEKIDFPIKKSDLQKEVLVYLEPTLKINSDNKQIISQASEIVDGEDDLFVVLTKLGDWIKNNVNYDINSLTEDSTKDSVWVLNNREGVCDEITTLFLAMARSLGVPAKYSYGLAYSNLDQFHDFVPHAWAEVYFPVYGWIQFDVTYGQYGYIDSSHIKLGDSIGTNKSSVSFVWRGYNFDVETNELDIDVEIDDYEPNYLDLIDIDVYPEKISIGPGSYNLINVLVKNKEDYYLSPDILLSKPRELDSYTDSKAITLGPNEEKLVGFIVRTPSDVDEDKIYTYPISVRSSMKKEGSESSFGSSVKDPVFSKDYFDVIIQQNQEEKEKAYSAQVDLNCTIGNEELYRGDSTFIDCNINNLGNIFLKGLELCLDGCVGFDLGINQGFNHRFEFNGSGDYGNKEAIVTLRNDYVFRRDVVKYVLLDTPNFKIVDVGLPTEVGYGDMFDVNVGLVKESFSSGKNAKIIVESGYLNRKQDIPFARTDIDMNFKGISSKSLSSGDNKVVVKIVYEDNNGNVYEDEKEVVIRLEASSWERFKLFFVHLFGLY